MDALGGQLAVGHHPQRAGGAAALGVHEQLGVRGGLDALPQVGGGDAGVHVALAHPDAHVGAAGDPLDVRAEELVGQEQHLAVGGDRLDDLDGVGRRAADVGLGLHLGGRVDVGDDDGARVLGLPGAQLVGGDGVGQRAAGVRVRHQHRLLGRQDLRRLGHEVHAREDDRRGARWPRRCGRARGSRRRGRRRPGSPAPGSCAPAGRRPSRRRAGGPRRARPAHWSGDQAGREGRAALRSRRPPDEGSFFL